MTDWKAFTVETKDHVAQVTLIGPGKGNSMGPDFWAELPQIFNALDADPEVRAVVLAGSGKHFSFGLDLQAMAPLFGARRTANQLSRRGQAATGVGHGGRRLPQARDRRNPGLVHRRWRGPDCCSRCSIRECRREVQYS